MNAKHDLGQIERSVRAAVQDVDSALQAFTMAPRVVQDPGDRQATGCSIRQSDGGAPKCHSTDIPDDLLLAGHGLDNTRTKLEQSQRRLSDLRAMLQRHLRDWEGDLRVLRSGRVKGHDVAVQFQRAEDGAQKDVELIRSLLDVVMAALTRAHRAMANTPGNIDAKPPRTSHEVEGVGHGELGMTAVTVETVRLLDVLRYGKTNCRLLLAYPTPRLSSRTKEGDGGLGKKILAGLGLCPGTETQDLRIEVSGFFRRLFRSGRDMPSGTHQGIGE